jgi:hypothetical protein
MRAPRGGSWLLAVVLMFCAGCAGAPVSLEPDRGGQASVSPEPDDGVQVLAKADGWRGSLVDFYGVVEVAYDEVAAAQAWEENVPADLVRRSGTRSCPGFTATWQTSTSTVKCWWSTPRVSPAPAPGG